MRPPPKRRAWLPAWADARQLIRTNSRFGTAEVDMAATDQQVADLQGQHPGELWVVPGFIAADAHGTTTTLGRGGSDYTAALLAAALEAEVLEIWTDVSGMMTADPRLVRSARPIARISYQEAMELSHFGAKVLYPPTIQPVMQRGIPLWIKNTFAPDDYGTLVEVEPPRTPAVVQGISSIGNLALLNLEGSGMVGIPGFSKRLFAALARERINVILITQSSSEHSICVGVNAPDAAPAQVAVDEEFATEIAAGRIEPLRPEHGPGHCGAGGREHERPPRHQRQAVWRAGAEWGEHPGHCAGRVGEEYFDRYSGGRCAQGHQRAARGLFRGHQEAGEPVHSGAGQRGQQAAGAAGAAAGAICSKSWACRCAWWPLPTAATAWWTKTAST